MENASTKAAFSPPRTAAGSGLRRMGTSLANKIRLMDRKDWFVAFLWLAALALMFAFIGVAAGVAQADPAINEDSVAAGTYTQAQLDAETVIGKDYANAVAIAGGLFAVALFAAIIMTVVFRFIQKKRESGAA